MSFNNEKVELMNNLNENVFGKAENLKSLKENEEAT